MSGKTLLSLLVLGGVVAALWLGVAAGGGAAGEGASGEGASGEGGGSEGDVGRVGEDDFSADGGGLRDVGEVGRGDFRNAVRGDGERGAAVARVKEEEEEEEAVAEFLRESQRRDGEGLVVETFADGSQSIDLQGRFQHVTRLVETADGRMVPVCGSDVVDAGVGGADE